MSVPATSIELSSGDWLNLADPQLPNIHLVDIATSLSRVNRFAGHTREFYSVAQHSVHVYELVCQLTDDDDLGTRLWALLHDAHEAYVGDVSSPLKVLLSQVAPGVLPRIVDKLDRLIAEKYWLDFDKVNHEIIKHADKIAIAAEAYYQMSSRGKDWVEDYCGKAALTLAQQIGELKGQDSETAYLKFTEAWNKAINAWCGQLRSQEAEASLAVTGSNSK